MSFAVLFLEQSFRPGRRSYRGSSWRSSARWQLAVIVVPFLTFALFGHRANSDEVGPSSGTALNTATVSTPDYYRKHGLWLVPATTNDQAGFALFGTGSNVVAVHAPNGAESFPNVRVRIPPSLGNRITVFADMPFQCLGLPKKSDYALGSDYKDRQYLLRIPLTAIAGAPYLRDHAFVLDPAVAKIQSVPSPVISAEGIQMAITWKDGVPQLPVAFPILGNRNVVLDTGCTACVWLSRERVDALERMGQLRQIRSLLIEEAGSGQRTDIPTNLSVLRYIDFAGVRFHNVPVLIADRDTIGLELLRYFRTTIDFPTGKVWCEKLKTDEVAHLLPPTLACAPFFSFRNAGALEVVDFNKYFSDVDHSLKKGDRVLKLNGADPKDLSSEEVYKVLSMDNTTVSLDMLRGAERFSVDLKLKLPYQWPIEWESAGVTVDEDFEASLK
jgi:hypothetical protein